MPFLETIIYHSFRTVFHHRKSLLIYILADEYIAGFFSGSRKIYVR